jgi:ATP-dependent RNA helicase DOB1
MSVIEEEYIASFKPELMDVVYSWSKGSNFQDIWFLSPAKWKTDL